jgi:phage terminase large subunit
VSFFRKSLPVLLREAQLAIEHRSFEAAAPVVLWQAPGEDDTRFDTRVAVLRARLPKQVTLVVACTPRPGVRWPGVTLVEFPPKMLALLNPGMKARYRVAYSGRGAAKSWSFARGLILRCLQAPIRVLCAREYQGSIAESVHKLLDGQINELDLDQWFTVQRDSITAFNGAEVIFAGLHHNVSKVKSTEDVAIAWVEEAERVSDESWQTLIPTIRRPGSEILVSFNPDAETDPVYQRFVKTPPPNTLVEFVSWRDNPWLPAELDAERQYLERVDPDAATHIWEGQCRAASNAQIFRNKYSVQAFEPVTVEKDGVKSWDGPYFGADWGFAQDPTTLVKTWIHERKLYVEYEVYAIGCDIDRTPQLFDQIPEARNHVCRADSARPETISYMQRNGYSRIQGVEKWSGSVEDGITRLRGFEQIVIHPRCVHAIEEARLYSYRTDRLTGDIKAEPADKHNHVWDAVRYAIQPLIRRSGFGFLGFIENEMAQMNRRTGA